MKNKRAAPKRAPKKKAVKRRKRKIRQSDVVNVSIQMPTYHISIVDKQNRPIGFVEVFRDVFQRYVDGEVFHSRSVNRPDNEIDPRQQELPLKPATPNQQEE